MRNCTPLRSWALPDGQIITKRGRRVEFHLPPLVRSLTVFCFFFTVTHGLEDSLEVEPLRRRELDFEDPGRSKCHFFSFGTSSKVIFCFMHAELHTFTPLGLPDRQIMTKRGHGSDFPPPPWSVFCHFFVIFTVFQRLQDFVEIEPPLGESFILKVQAAPNVVFSLLEPLPKISWIFEARRWRGGGPRGKT